MRIFYLLLLSNFFLNLSYSQDKKLLEKQLSEIMIDYPNKFKNLRKPVDSFFLKFQITGTIDDPIIMGDKTNVYISASLGNQRSDAEAKAVFEKWETIINSISLNGAALKSSDCVKDKFTIYCKKWKFDNSKNNIAGNYLPFTITINFLKVGDVYAGGLYIGD